MADIRKLLESIDRISTEGSMSGAAKHKEGAKFGGYWKGTDKNPPTKGMGVGGESADPKFLGEPYIREDDEEEKFEEICPACDGGGTEYGDTCVRCGGKGYLKNGEYDYEETDEGYGARMMADASHIDEEERQPRDWGSPEDEEDRGDGEPLFNSVDNLGEPALTYEDVVSAWKQVFPHSSVGVAKAFGGGGYTFKFRLSKDKTEVSNGILDNDPLNYSALLDTDGTFKEYHTHMFVKPPEGANLVYSSEKFRKKTIKNATMADLVKRFEQVHKFVSLFANSMKNIKFDINEKLGRAVSEDAFHSPETDMWHSQTLGGMFSEDESSSIAEGAVRDIEQKLKDHAQRKIDQEKKTGQLSGPDLFSHEQHRKQLLKKRQRALSNYRKKFNEDEEYRDSYEDEDGELYNGCYVRDQQNDGANGEVFKMSGDPSDRRVRIEDKDGRGWYIHPSRLTFVSEDDPAVAEWFGGRDDVDEGDEMYGLAGASGSMVEGTEPEFEVMAVQVHGKDYKRFIRELNKRGISPPEIEQQIGNHHIYTATSEEPSWHFMKKWYFDHREEDADIVHEAKAPSVISRLKQAKEDGTIRADQISKDKEGNFIFRKGYYYKNGFDSTKFAERIDQELTAAGIPHEIIGDGDHWAAFKGGAKVAQQSHFWVKVRISSEQPAADPIDEADEISDVVRNRALAGAGAFSREDPERMAIWWSHYRRALGNHYGDRQSRDYADRMTASEPKYQMFRSVKEQELGEITEELKTAFEDYVKNKSDPEDKKERVTITYNDGHKQTKSVTEKEKKRYKTSSSVKSVVPAKDSKGRLDDAITEGIEGASAAEIADAIAYRITRQKPELLSKYGVEFVTDTIDEVANFHEGADELGSSDISAMVNDVERQLVGRVEGTNESVKIYPGMPKTILTPGEKALKRAKDLAYGYRERNMVPPSDVERKINAAKEMIAAEKKSKKKVKEGLGDELSKAKLSLKKAREAYAETKDADDAADVAHFRKRVRELSQKNVKEGAMNTLGRKMRMATTSGRPDAKSAPKWATHLGRTHEGAFHWLEKYSPVEVDNNDKYFPNAGKTKYTGFTDKQKGKGYVKPIDRIAEGKKPSANRDRGMYGDHGLDESDEYKPNELSSRQRSKLVKRMQDEKWERERQDQEKQKGKEPVKESTEGVMPHAINLFHSIHAGKKDDAINFMGTLRKQYGDDFALRTYKMAKSFANSQKKQGKVEEDGPAIDPTTGQPIQQNATTVTGQPAKTAQPITTAQTTAEQPPAPKGQPTAIPANGQPALPAAGQAGGAPVQMPAGTPKPPTGSAVNNATTPVQDLATGLQQLSQPGNQVAAKKAADALARVR